MSVETHAHPQTTPERVALVTGSGTGLGAHIAERLAERGFRVWHHCQRNLERAEAQAARVDKRFPNRAMGALRADLRHANEVEAIFDRVRRVSGRLDVLVNNVGVYHRKPIDEVTPEEWCQVTESNLNGTFFCIHYAMPMLRDSAGLVINIGDGSLEHQASDIYATAYRASKHGILVLTRSFAEQCGRHGVRFNMVSPGLLTNSTWTPEEAITSIPLGRVGRFDDVWRACEYLISGDYVTGANIDVTGGYRLSLALWYGRHEAGRPSE